MEHFVIIVNGWKPLTIITKHSILDVAAALNLPLIILDGIIIMVTAKMVRPSLVGYYLSGIQIRPF